MIVGCYDLHLYCANALPEVFEPEDIKPGESHYYNSFPHSFTGETLAECKKKARLRGWVFKNDDVVCPTCSGRKPR